MRERGKVILRASLSLPDLMSCLLHGNTPFWKVFPLHMCRWIRVKDKKMDRKRREREAAASFFACKTAVKLRLVKV